VSALEAALAKVHDALTQDGIPYMVIGGIAVAQWGVPRATLDVDVTVWVDEPRLVAVVNGLCARFRPLAPDPLGFLRETRVLPLDVDGVRADVLFALLPYERAAIDRAIPKEVSGRPIRFCSAEDLILHKALSDRPKDLEDLRGVLAVRRGSLDTDYLEPRLRELADLLDRPALWQNYLQFR
jgi:hypothetical protein